MVRCGCSSDSCSCNFVAGDNVTISGSGSRSNPYVVEAAAVAASSDSGRFAGEIIAFAGTTAPAGWLACDGAAVSRTTQSVLFAAIGTSYGAGNGTTTFNVPNLAGRFPMGTSGTHARGATGGSETSTLDAANVPSHTHPIDHNHAAFTTGADGSHVHTIDYSTATGTSGANVPLGTGTKDRTSDAAVAPSTHTHNIDVPAFAGTSGTNGGAATAFTTLSPYQAVGYLIKT